MVQVTADKAFITAKQFMISNGISFEQTSEGLQIEIPTNQIVRHGFETYYLMSCGVLYTTCIDQGRGIEKILAVASNDDEQKIRQLSKHSI